MYATHRSVNVTPCIHGTPFEKTGVTLCAAETDELYLPGATEIGFCRSGVLLEKFSAVPLQEEHAAQSRGSTDWKLSKTRHKNQLVEIIFTNVFLSCYR